MKRPRHIRPRLGTLWLTDGYAVQVKSAEHEWTERLADPVWFEALQRVRRNPKVRHLLRGLSGRNAKAIGELARYLQLGDAGGVNLRRAARGRPPIAGRAAIDRALFVVEALKTMRRATSDVGALRYLLRAWYPTADAKQLERTAHRVAQDLYEHRSYVKSMKTQAVALEKSRISHLQEISQVT